MTLHADVRRMEIDQVDREIRWIAALSSNKWTTDMADRLSALRLRRQEICGARCPQTWRTTWQ